MSSMTNTCVSEVYDFSLEFQCQVIYDEWSFIYKTFWHRFRLMNIIIHKAFQIWHSTQMGEYSKMCLRIRRHVRNISS